MTDAFKDFTIMEVPLPQEVWSKLYDMEHQIIWINTAAEEANNVVKLEPKKW